MLNPKQRSPESTVQYSESRTRGTRGFNSRFLLQTITRKAQRCIIIAANALVAAALLFPLAACDNAADNPDNQPSRTLTISQCWDVYNMDAAIERFKSAHPDVEIILTKYNGNYEKFKMQVTTQLIAGTADDIIDMLGFPGSPTLAENGYTADLYPLMQNDPDFDVDDYFTSVFTGMEHRGRLHTFPLEFLYRLVGVNNVFSDELASDYMQYETISHRDMLKLHDGLEEKGNRYPSENLDGITAITTNFKSFVDYESREAFFDSDGFVSFIKQVRDATDPKKIEDGRLGNEVDNINELHMQASAGRYLFAETGIQNEFVHFPSVGNGQFTHFIPLANDEGKIIITPGTSLAISEASGEKGLAWEFIKFLATDDPIPDDMVLQAARPFWGMPINRTLFRKQAGLFYTGVAQRYIQHTGPINAEIPAFVEQIITRMENYNEMPMEFSGYFDVGDGILLDIISRFYMGDLTAEQAASELQNKYSLYMME